MEDARDYRAEFRRTRELNVQPFRSQTWMDRMRHRKYTEDLENGFLLARRYEQHHAPLVDICMRCGEFMPQSHIRRHRRGVCAQARGADVDPTATTMTGVSTVSNVSTTSTVSAQVPNFRRLFIPENVTTVSAIVAHNVRMYLCPTWQMFHPDTSDSCTCVLAHPVNDAPHFQIDCQFPNTMSCDIDVRVHVCNENDIEVDTGYFHKCHSVFAALEAVIDFVRRYSANF